MCQSPNTLEDLCLESVCENILTYIEPVETKELCWNSSEDNDSSEDECTNFRFKDPEIFLIRAISEKLLNRLVEKRLLRDSLLNIFSNENTKLTKFKIQNCNKVSKTGLQILKHHKIQDLECVKMEKVSIGEIIDCLNQWSIDNITAVNFSKCSFIDESRYTFMMKISDLKNLRILNLSYTELNQTVFEMICEDLIHLEKLNISGTLVVDLMPLALLSSKLTSLSICDLSSAENVITTIRQLKLLRFLDISLCIERVESELSYLHHHPVIALLEDPDVLPELSALDISGWKVYSSKDELMTCIESHPKLEYLGIVLCPVAFDPVFSDSGGINHSKNLVIAGLGNEEQIKVTLKKYKDRSNYVQKALYYLFQLTSSFQEARPDVFNLVLPVMEANCSIFGVQMAATACLYNLTRGELSKTIHPRALSKGVNLTLYAMEYFPGEFQLQKNSLLTLCSDRILQDVHFDKFRCARLVLDALCRFEDVNMDRMAVAICSILAAKVSTEETSELGARPEYMKKLLTMVQTRVDTKVPDITLKFTLSALWNLTDESSATCQVFLEQKGAHLFFNVLKTFKDNSAIETKVLGLLNNIAEVSPLRCHLMMDPLMDELCHLLASDNIDVGYFAAGIVAHLASDGDQGWKISCRNRRDMLMELEKAVAAWKTPASEMVAYRSFKPFFSLLSVGMDYQVQLWAVWAIHHVCTKNPKRYCKMLQEEKGHIMLNDLISHPGSHQQIKNICSNILETFGM
ncbi:unnamed protein product [Phaedon cochleariae]|uniref:Uncharacterized protein n=1 Tax=Phaedon cochleariae TaxID=80249 RepID=A0A9P0DFC2_PHACE|nr:unnamed protein product [Phaedon cochleariae]